MVIKFFKKNIVEFISCLFLLILYVKTLLPDIGYSGDTCQFQLIGKIFGVAHFNGYPTYILLNNIFQKFFPFFTLSYKSNLLSAVFTLISILIIFKIFQHFKIKKSITAFLAITFGTTPTLWSQSIIAEVYTLNLLFLTIIILFLLKWTADQKKPFYLYLAILFYSLSLGNHFKMILISPAILFFIFKTDRSIFYQPKKVFLLTSIFITGLLPYLLTFIGVFLTKSPLINSTVFHDMLQTPRFQHLRGLNILFPYSIKEIIFERFPYFLDLFIKEWGYFFLLLPIFAFFKIDKKIYIFLLLIFGPTLFFSINYGIFDIEPFLIPVYFIFLIFLGFSFNYLFQRFNKKKFLLPLALLLLIITTGKIFKTYRIVDQSKNTATRDLVLNILEYVENDALIVTPCYMESQCFFYYLLEMKYQKDYNIFAAHLINSKNIKLYLSQEKPIFLHQQRFFIKPGLRIFVMNMDLINEFLKNDDYMVKKTPLENLYEIVYLK